MLEEAGSAANAAAAAPVKKKGDGGKSAVAQVLSNTANGFITVSVYFADIISDIQVRLLPYDASSYAEAGPMCTPDASPTHRSPIKRRGRA